MVPETLGIRSVRQGVGLYVANGDGGRVAAGLVRRGVEISEGRLAGAVVADLERLGVSVLETFN